MKENSSENRKKVNKPFIISICTSAAIIVIFAALALFAMSGEGVAKGVMVEGEKVSGMSKDEVETLITEKLIKEVPDENVIVHFNGENYTIPFKDAIFEYDAAKTAEIACSAGRNNIFKRVWMLFKSENIPLEPAINEEYVARAIDEICKNITDLKTDDYYFMEEDKLKLVFGKEGNYIDVDSFRKQFDDFLRKGKGGEITLEVVYAQPKQFDINEIYKTVAKAPTDTYYEEIDGKKYIKSAQNGYKFDKSELKAAIEENRGVNESFYFLPEVIEPQNTELDETGLFTEVLAKYTSKITDQDRNRLNNVHLASSKINGVIINPGDVFKYLSYVEPITVEGGYKTANVYANGKITQDIGGGVCQVSSALYSAVLNANLEVVKRYNHSLTVGYVPYGQDATVSSGEIDFRFKNDTNEPVKIVASSDNAGVYITLLGKKVDPSVSVEIENVITQTLVPEVVETEDETLAPGEKVVDYAGKTGYVVQTYKHIYKDGVLSETVHVSTSRYKKIDKTVRKGPAAEQTDAEVTKGEEANQPEAEEEKPADGQLTETQPTEDAISRTEEE